MRKNGIVLIIDDNPDDILLILKGFERAGFDNKVVNLGDGEEALLYLKGLGKYSNRIKYPIPALILLDVKMPKVDGFSVLRWIRQHPEWQCLPVIILSTSFYGPEIIRAYELGANSFLTKPSDFHEYMAAIRNLARYWLEDNVLPSPGPFVPPPESQASISDHQLDSSRAHENAGARETNARCRSQSPRKRHPDPLPSRTSEE
jgi:two-component system response regulator